MTDSTWRKSGFSGSHGANCVELRWRTSSFTNSDCGNCVELAWRKSSFSGSSGGNCVELAHDAPSVQLRDTKNRAAGTLVLGATAWRGLLNFTRVT